MPKRPATIALLILGAAVVLSSCGRKYRLKPDNLSAEGSWSCSQGSSSRTGAIREGFFDGRLQQLWARDLGGKLAGPLALHNQTLVYPETKKRIRFYDTESGRYLGRLRIKGIPQTGVAIVDSLAFWGVSPKKNLLGAYNLLEGKRLWQRRVKDANPGPIILDDRLIVSSSEGVVFALGLHDGEPVWTFTAGRRLTASASYSGGRLYQPGDQGWLYALAPDDGRELFRVELDGAIAAPVAVSDRVYAADVTGRVYALDPADGSVLWQTLLAGPVWSTPAVADGRLYIGHSGGEVVALDASNGDVIWCHETGAVVRASALAFADFVVAGTMAGGLIVLNATDGSLVDSTTLQGAIEFPPVTDGRRLFVATQAGKIVCFGENNEQADLIDYGVTPQRQPQR